MLPACATGPNPHFRSQNRDLSYSVFSLLYDDDDDDDDGFYIELLSAVEQTYCAFLAAGDSKLIRRHGA